MQLQGNVFNRRVAGWRHHFASNPEATNLKRKSQATYPKYIKIPKTFVMGVGLSMIQGTPTSVEPVSKGFLTLSIGRLLSWQNIRFRYPLRVRWSQRVPLTELRTRNVPSECAFH